MELAAIAAQYQHAFIRAYAHQLLPSHRAALAAIGRCRTPAAGELHLHCRDCAQEVYRPLSCGHRSCPKCQHHEASQWLERQQAKLLPVDYFMVTFTVPRELRVLAWQHQKTVYACLFASATETLKAFGLNPKHLGGQLGMTAVLHTHSRRLDYHPHVHIIVPGAGVDPRRRQWKKKRGKYLFNAVALARVFRGKLLAALRAASLPVPATPSQWVVDCTRVGRGKPALLYLSRYLYRGVISEKDIIANREGQVTFRYTDSRSGQVRTRTLPGAEFLWLVLQHALPRGFRRVRDYGFLHGNAKRLLALVQLILQVTLEPQARRSRPVFTCPSCRSPMRIIARHRHGRDP